MPLAVAMAWAMGVVTKPCITSCVAPGNAVSIVIVALSIRGYCRTGRLNVALTPTSRISRLTTIARMGRRIKMSVNAISAASSSCGGGHGHVRAGLDAKLPFRHHDIAGLQAPSDHSVIADSSSGAEIG